MTKILSTILCITLISCATTAQTNYDKRTQDPKISTVTTTANTSKSDIAALKLQIATLQKSIDSISKLRSDLLLLQGSYNSLVQQNSKAQLKFTADSVSFLNVIKVQVKSVQDQLDALPFVTFKPPLTSFKNKDTLEVGILVDSSGKTIVPVLKSAKKQ